MARQRQALRCKAANRRGEQCGNYSVAGTTVCRMHGGCAPQVRRAARDALNTDLARRVLASMRGDFRSDGRIGPREWSPYGLLPPSRRETYLSDRNRLRQMVRADLEARYAGRPG